MTELTDRILGMLYIVELRLVHKITGERRKHRILLVGCEQSDIERKLKWIFDATEYSQFSVSDVQKVREKVHFISTTITQESEPGGPVIEREDKSQTIYQNQTLREQYDPKLYAVGVSTTMLAKDERHAMRKVGNAIIAAASEGASHNGPKLSDDSTLVIEEVSKSSGYAMPRDVSKEKNKARFFRG